MQDALACSLIEFGLGFAHFGLRSRSVPGFNRVRDLFDIGAHARAACHVALAADFILPSTLCGGGRVGQGLTPEKKQRIVLAPLATVNCLLCLEYVGLIRITARGEELFQHTGKSTGSRIEA